MTAAVETMAYAGEVPWHGLGSKVSNKLTADQMLKAAGLNWQVAKRPLLFKKPGGGYGEVKDKYALVRATDERVLSVVGSTYKPVQNDVAMDFFKKFVQAGKMNMETAGSLYGGQYIWGLARLGKDFSLGKDDEVRGFLLLSQPHVIGKAMAIQFTPIRVVCWNTLTYALGQDLKGHSGAFRMPHSMAFNDAVRSAAESALGLASNQMAEFEQAAKVLSKAKAKPAEVEKYFAAVLKYDLKKAAADAKKNKREPIVPRMLPKLQQALLSAPGASLGSAQGTWWGALNAVTYVVDYETGRKEERSAALRTAWFGAKAGLKRRAVKMALDLAK